ncbi:MULTISPECIES: cupin domain-containing protein [unclassified Streptomyces]|uniref:cupin domain-containing protein n=1 Tax=unclassified Streptomyces TaxID=2593676 RepID=UPI002DDC0175|nr:MULTISPECIES: cupin domain-containing protein [unclassified Streptomyces]WSE09065.1 cupin domain-containing protein [Streptomyces sp. NBC_01445]
MIKNPRIVDLSDTEPNRRRGGDLRAMLTPATVGSTSGFMGLALVQPGERIGEHYHPYSEEFVYVVNGALEVDLDGETYELRPDQGLLIPINMRHRFRNVGDVEARMVFHLGPLAPRPSLGHVDTEETEGAEAGPGFITGGPDLTAPGHGRPSERSGAIT